MYSHVSALQLMSGLQPLQQVIVSMEVFLSALYMSIIVALGVLPVISTYTKPNLCAHYITQ